MKEYEAKCKAEGIEPEEIKPKADFHAEVAQLLFNELDEMEKVASKKHTQDNSTKAQDKFEEDMQKPTARDPASHQR